MAEPTIISDETEQFFEKVKSYMPGENLVKLRDAVSFAGKAHGEQIRKSGEPYFIHPLKTAEILTGFHVDEDTLIAAVLHDIPEDTDCPISEIEKRFGKKIAYLVDGITKLSKVHYRHDMEQRQIESLKKLFIHSAEDLRVILIKLADRLHNMRTLGYIADEAKRKRISRETMEIYVPIANLLNINELRTELEDLCFQHLWPEEYKKLKREVEENVEERNFILDEMIHLADRELKKNKIEAQIFGRTKTLYSISRKIQTTKKDLASIDDLLAIRVIVPTRKDCYTVLGIIHRLFRPRMDRFKDYIAVPKTNGYQSLHTTVFGINSSTIEFQVRTRYMHLEAEYGVAAHYFYKYSSEHELAAIMKQRSTWVQKILEMQKEQEDNRDFLKNLKLDIFQDRIFIFSPKGDVVDLPKGATPLDFAYAIHTDIGNHAKQALINGVPSTLFTPLVTGDTVRIIVTKEKAIEHEWLYYAKTNLAYNKIKVELKKLPYQEKLAIGKRCLQKQFDRIGRNFLEELTSKNMKIIATKFSCKTLEQLLAAIGEGQINPRDILTLLYEKSPLAKKSLFGSKSGVRKKGFLSRIGLRILGYNDNGQFREILRTLNGLKIPIVKFIIDSPKYLKYDRCRLTILIKDYDELAQVFEGLEHVEGIKKISRTFTRRKIVFYLWSMLTVAVWLSHPIALGSLLKIKTHGSYFQTAFYLFGIALLFGLILYMRRIAKRSFPELQETRFFWILLMVLTTLALVTVLSEIVVYKLQFNWIIILGLILFIYALIMAEYLRFKEEQFG